MKLAALNSQRTFANRSRASSGGYMAEKEEKKGSMTVREAGHKGGEKTSETHGHEFYEKIGHKGGEKVSEEKGPEFYEKIGHKGGETTLKEHGPEFYSKIGHKGGQKVKELIEKAEEEEKK
jgi:general stress protein YciG